MKPAIQVEGLSKQFRLGGRSAGYRTFRESLDSGIRSVVGRRAGATADGREFWALKDVSFQVRPGEVVGIIGRNGSGKSTLLKILSRIYEPTAGQAVVRGRMASLLEVGTGFHQELSGRDNIYLNGSILGMTRHEISRKFDEIVAFSEVEKFLDTPVKRYSSGMYVRLAFAVAAHLEPEILVVDEVLAVGDAGFQQRCFRRMEEVRRSGRTVLIVSHNLGVISALCNRTVTLEQGRLTSQGDPQEQIARYLGCLSDISRMNLADRTDREGGDRIRLIRVTFANSRGHPINQAVSGEDLELVLECQAIDPAVRVECVALSCWNTDGTKIFHVDNLQRGQVVVSSGKTRAYRCRFPRLPLPAGSYHWNFQLRGEGETLDHVYSCATLDVVEGDYYHCGRTSSACGGLLFVAHDWA